MKKWKKILIMLFILPCMIFFHGCSCNNNNGSGSSNIEITHVVTFYTDSEDSFNIPNQTVKDKGLVRRPVDPIKEGHRFVGWYRDKDRTIVWKFESDLVTSRMTLYAKWEERKV